MFSADAMNSLGRWPCVTITPPTTRTGSTFEGCESITFILLSRSPPIRLLSFGPARPFAYRGVLLARQSRRAAIAQQAHSLSSQNGGVRRCNQSRLSDKTYLPADIAARGNKANR